MSEDSLLASFKQVCIIECIHCQCTCSLLAKRSIYRLITKGIDVVFFMYLKRLSHVCFYANCLYAWTRSRPGLEPLIGVKLFVRLFLLCRIIPFRAVNAKIRESHRSELSVPPDTLRPITKIFIVQ
jgi:hypothetical protein